MWSVITETVRVLNESAIYLLVGFALAGVMHVLFNQSKRFARLLSARGSRSVVLAALLGVPLPLCSCSVLPAGLAQRKQGASKGATPSFMLKVPEKDVVSIIMTYGLLGPLMAVFRPLAAVITAIATGHLINLTEHLHEPPAAGRPDASGSPDAAEKPTADTCCECSSEGEPQPGVQAPGGLVGRALRYGFVEFFDDIVGTLVVGLVLGGVVTALMPAFGLERFTGGSLITMLVMLAVGIPMYVCATSSTPIAAGLMAGGLSPGAALVFLLAGPATNMASLVVLGKHRGRLPLVVYLLSIAAVSVLMGLSLDAIVETASIPVLSAVAPTARESAGPVKIGAAILFTLLTCLSLRRIRFLQGIGNRITRTTGIRLGRKTTMFVAAVAVTGAY